MQTTFVAATPIKASVQAPRQARRNLTVSCAQTTERRNILVDGAKTLTAGLMAAALVIATPSVADAKVILVQPEVKNLVKGTAPAQSSSSSAAPTKAVTKRTPPPAQTSEGFDFKPLVLPLSLVAVAGLGVAIGGDDEFWAEAGAKDSRAYAGYETSLKDTPFFGGSGSIASSTPAAKGGKKGGKKK